MLYPRNFPHSRQVAGAAGAVEEGTEDATSVGAGVSGVTAARGGAAGAAVTGAGGTGAGLMGAGVTDAEVIDAEAADSGSADKGRIFSG